MARRIPNIFWNKSVRRTLNVLSRAAVRVGAKALKQSLKQTSRVAPKKRPSSTTRRRPATTAAPAGQWKSGVAVGPTGTRRYQLYIPPALHSDERLALVVMLHGCSQDAQALADSSRMNRIAAREHFMVLYPQQDPLSNAQGCWNWYATRTGLAQHEADSIDATLEHICRQYPVDRARVALAGLSAGASMAAWVATRHPSHYQAIAMHSGVAPGAAHSLPSALAAMRGRKTPTPLAPLPSGQHLPALLVIQGHADPIVAASNGIAVARLWTVRENASPGKPRTVQRGARYSASITDFKAGGRLVASLCVIQGLGHAWSGGAASCSYSDPKGPDASRMIWAFAARQFARTAATPGPNDT
jgi:poly(hydroxyalkanoate) depolymerase family esterase